MPHNLLDLIRSAGGLDAAHKSGLLHQQVKILDPAECPEVGRELPTQTDERAMPLQWVPLINRVAAGRPIEFADLGYPARAADRYIGVPGLNDPDAFAAYIHGSSMAPEYRDGDIVIFSPAAVLADGMDCFCRVAPDNDTTFKRVFLEEDGATLRLQPLNPAHRPQTYAREDVYALVPAVRMIRRLEAVA